MKTTDAKIRGRSFPARLRSAMRHAGFDPDAHIELTRLSLKSGVSLSTLQRYLRGESVAMPTVRTLFALGRALGVREPFDLMPRGAKP